jgi:hypothetical protein
MDEINTMGKKGCKYYGIDAKTNAGISGAAKFGAAV